MYCESTAKTITTLGESIAIIYDEKCLHREAVTF